MCGVTSHNVTHDVTGSKSTPRLREVVHVKACTQQTALYWIGGDGCPG